MSDQSKKFWNDVLSKVIAGIILAMLGAMYIWLQATWENISFADYLRKTVTTQIWIVLLVFIIVISRILLDILQLYKFIKKKNETLLPIYSSLSNDLDAWQEDYIKFKKHDLFSSFLDAIPKLKLPGGHHQINADHLKYFIAVDLIILASGSYQLTPKGEEFLRLNSKEKYDGPLK